MFHLAFFNSIIDKHQHMHFFIQHYIKSRMLISLKYIKILKSTPTCFDLNRSSSGSMSASHLSYWIFKNLKNLNIIKTLNLKPRRSIPVWWQQYM